jgi:cell division protein FtsZ
MGGGTATAGCSSIARAAKKMEIPSIFIATAPFSFEGHSKRKKAENGIKMLLADAELVISIPNDILYSSCAVWGLGLRKEVKGRTSAISPLKG